MTTTDRVPPVRLFFLDWVRIIAFFILIAYHVGMYYVTWGWHVKSAAAGPAAEPFMLMSSPWRLDLLFLVAGVASSFMLSRASILRVLRQRSVRLLLPLVFGMLVVVPPQSYFQVVDNLGYAGSYWDFMDLYLSRYRGFMIDGERLILPTWNHLWFVAYLWIYTLGLGALVALLGERFDTLAERAGKLLGGWKLVVLPAAVLLIARVLLADRFPANHAVVGDWFNHATYFFLFVLGALLARAPQFWPRLENLRWLCLGIAAAGWSVVVVWWAIPDNFVPDGQMVYWRPALRTVYCLFAWCAIGAACGFARRHLNHDGPARRYLTEAVFPVYIAHQTLIVVLAHGMKPLHLAPGLEAVLLVVMTLTGSFGLFELVRRVALLRPLFGLAAQVPRQAAPRQLAANAA
jgi:surface polysaccharide O-acyltransferase-like enzyme